LKKVVICIPTYQEATEALRKSLEAADPLIRAAGYDLGFVGEKGNAYISAARATMLRAALTAKADIIVFIDDDVSFDPENLLTLIETPGFVVAGTYRTREDKSNYMGRPVQTLDGKLTSVRDDGCIEMTCVPAGFLKVTVDCVVQFMREYPELCYGSPYNYSVDLFNHGAHKGLWWGEDYAFCRRWRDAGGQIWCIPNLNINHNDRKSGKVWKGNYHEFWQRQPGGAKEGQPYDDPDYGFPEE
jgi:glycosyltransferase involved in cell wall biosynthesis